ncbi:TPA: hypothetical protein ACWP58_004522 [Escherichia coli]
MAVREHERSSARQRRLARNLVVDIDEDEVLKIIAKLGGSKSQIRKAWGVALKRAASALRMKAMAEFKKQVAPRSQKMLEKRVLHNFIIRRNGDEFDEAKVWFGLNAIKVRDLRGRISGGRRGERHQLRDERGRFAPASSRRKAREISFKPAGESLPVTAWSTDDAFINQFEAENRNGRISKRKTILIRQASGRRRVREAEIDIYEAMLNRIEDFVFPDAEALILKNFEHELKFRVFKGLE